MWFLLIFTTHIKRLLSNLTFICSFWWFLFVNKTFYSCIHFLYCRRFFSLDFSSNNFCNVIIFILWFIIIRCQCFYCLDSVFLHIYFSLFIIKSFIGALMILKHVEKIRFNHITHVYKFERTVTVSTIKYKKMWLNKWKRRAFQ